VSGRLVAHFQLLARYNQGANDILFAAVAKLDDAERKKQRPAFFGSIHGTLNHILLGDRIWLGRFEGGTMASTNLDAILYKHFEELRQARAEEDARLSRLTAGLDATFLDGSIAYVNNQGFEVEDPAGLLLAHLFNHQTHHRGQVHDMLSQTEVPPPSLDMHRVINPTPG